ncbi:MAG TPA: class I SAM-dependent methyltransferase [Nitrospirales bacterium]|nr:SAM-dependent methyltransferase [Nitrospiraceae bacterium]HNP28105.1 class I SAM-dependent methyltransferase [Nitrospirales bacterium]
MKNPVPTILNFSWKCSLAFLSLVGLAVLPVLDSSRAAEEDKERWNKKYETERYLFGRDPIPFLQDHLGLLPKGAALDLAMGEGRNGVFLATKGFQVTGVDISEAGFKKAQAMAAEKGVTLTTVVADLEQYTIPPNIFDVILCTYYLQRDLFPKMAAALKPGGMILIETYTVDHLQYRPQFNKEFLLRRNELLTLLPGLRVLRYQEVDTGDAAFASILAQKP